MGNAHEGSDGLSVTQTSAPRWEIPYPPGALVAVETMGTVAAPLLAGFSITLALFVVQAHGSLHWPNVALVLLVVAALTLLGALQATFWARYYSATPPELAGWWEASLNNPDRLRAVQDEQRILISGQRTWARRARLSYNVGLISLLLAFPVVLVPAGGLANAGFMRCAAILLAFLGFLVEAAWIAGAESPRCTALWRRRSH